MRLSLFWKRSIIDYDFKGNIRFEEKAARTLKRQGKLLKVIHLIMILNTLLALIIWCNEGMYEQAGVRSVTAADEIRL